MEIIKNTVTEIVQGTTGQVVADMLNPVIASIYGVEQYEITQTDVVDYKVTYNHLKSTYKILPFLYDSSWRQLNTSDIFSLTDLDGESSDEYWTLNVDNEIDTILHLFVIYLA
jgi:hypothetical protein